MTRSIRRSPMRPAGATPSGFFVLRTPLLPIGALTALGESLARAGRADPDRAAEALAADRRLVRARLRELVAQPIVSEAIFLASPGLAASLPTWQRDPESARGQRIERALYRHIAQMAGQPAAGGALAGSSTGAIAGATELTLEARASYRRRSRLDVGLVAVLTEQQLAGRRELREQLRYRVNASVYRTAGRVHVAAVQLGAATGGIRLVTAELTPYLDATLRRAEGGAALGALAEALVRDDSEIGLDEARDFVHELVDAQLLVAPLAPSLTGDDPVGDFLAELRRCAGTDEVVGRLSDAEQALAALDREPLGAPVDLRRAISRALDGLAAPAVPTRFHVELTKASPRATLGHRVITEVLRGVEILRHLAQPSPVMRRFVEAFAMRYGDAEVPLLEALDDDLGVGFDASMASSAAAAPLLQGLSFPAADAVAAFAPRQALLLRRIEETRRNGDTVLHLSPGDLERLFHREPAPLPASFAAVVRVAAASPEALARGDFRVVVERVSGPSGVARLAGSAAGDPALRARIAEHLRAEESRHPDALFAEIVHRPAAAAAHSVVRPVLRSHEIVYLGRSGARDDAQLPVSDLTIAIGGDEQIVLRSTRLGREVRPRLTAPRDHAEPPAPGVYRFLCALQHQGTAAELGFRWGALDALGFLPRVQVGRVILARARWRLFADQLQAVVAPGESRFAAVQKLREALGIPRRVELDDGDAGVVLDLDNPLCIDVLAEHATRRPDVRLGEIYPPLDELCTLGPEGHFVGELVIPFVRDAAAQPATVRPTARRPVVDRFTPGTEWLQVNLYTASSTADDVLRALVAPQMAHARSSGTLDRWFFVRYSQPDWHVRLHIHGEPAALLTNVVPSLHAAAADLLRDGRLWKLQLDTYRREVERYGGPEGIEIAEAIFHADSEAVVGIVELLEGDDGENARWRLCLRGVDLLLTDLGLPLSDRHGLVRRARASFAQTLRVERGLEHQLAARYRGERASLEALLDPASDQTSELAPAIALLYERSRTLAPSVQRLAAHARSGDLSHPIDELARSYVHMFANRLLRSAAVAQELVLYDWLSRLYESELARRRG